MSKLDEQVIAQDPSSPDAVLNATQSKMHRFQIGDKVSFEDLTEWPPNHLEGTITEFTNEEGTYIKCDFGDGGSMILTEDEVKRIG